MAGFHRVPWIVASIGLVACVQTQQHNDPVVTVTPITVSTADVSSETWPVVRTIEQTNWLYTVAWSPDSSKIATAAGHVGGEISQVLVYDVKTGELLYARDTPSIYSLTHLIAWAYSEARNSSLIAAGGLEGEVYLWDGETGVEVHRLDNGNASTLMGLEFNADGNFLAIGRLVGGDRQVGVTIWNVITGEEEFDFPEIDHVSEDEPLVVRDIAWWATQNRLEIATNHLGIISWDTSVGALDSILSDTSISLIEISSDETRMVVGSQLELSIWDLANHSLLYKFDPIYTIYDAAFSPNGEILAIATQDIVLLDGTSGKVIQVIEQYAVQDIEWSPDGTMLAAADVEITIYAYQSSQTE